MSSPVHAGDDNLASFHVQADTCSPYRGIVLYKLFSYIYILTSEQIYLGLSRTATGSIHIYGICHRLMHAQSPTKLYHRPLVRFLLTKRDTSGYRHPTAGVCLSEHVMTGQQRWRVCTGGGDSCVAICK